MKKLINQFNRAIDIIVINPKARYVLINRDTFEIITFESYYDYLLYISSSSGSHIYLDFRLSSKHTKIVEGNSRYYRSPNIGLVSIHSN